jgi:uncharacterized membrane protein (Fun14 family)
MPWINGKLEKRVPIWLAALMIATLLGLGGFIGLFIGQPVKEAIKLILPSTRLN